MIRKSNGETLFTCLSIEYISEVREVQVANSSLYLILETTSWSPKYEFGPSLAKIALFLARGSLKRSLDNCDSSTYSSSSSSS